MEFATSALLFCQMQSKIHQRASLPDSIFLHACLSGAVGIWSDYSRPVDLNGYRMAKRFRLRVRVGSGTNDFRKNLPQSSNKYLLKRMVSTRQLDDCVLQFFKCRHRFSPSLVADQSRDGCSPSRDNPTARLPHPHPRKGHVMNCDNTPLLPTPLLAVCLALALSSGAGLGVLLATLARHGWP